MGVLLTIAATATAAMSAFRTGLVFYWFKLLVSSQRSRPLKKAQKHTPLITGFFFSPNPLDTSTNRSGWLFAPPLAIRSPR